jgi:hypothetical protein
VLSNAKLMLVNLTLARSDKLFAQGISVTPRARCRFECARSSVRRFFFVPARQGAEPGQNCKRANAISAALFCHGSELLATGIGPVGAAWREAEMDLAAGLLLTMNDAILES